MHKYKKVSVALALVAMFSLMACNPSNESTTSEELFPTFDVNIYDQPVANDVAEKWVIDVINQAKTIDGVKVKSNVKKYTFEQSYISNDEKISKESSQNLDAKSQSIAAKAQQVIRVNGLSEKEPNNVMASYVAKNVNLIIKKKGINPAKNDRVQMNDGVAASYLRNNKQYTDISNPQLRESFPYLLYTFGDYDSVEKAKEDANNAPDKFYDPTPLLRAEDLPIIDHLMKVKDADITKVFNKIMDLNNESKTKFITFTTDGNDLLMGIKLNKTILSDIIVDYLVANEQIQDAAELRYFLNSILVVNNMQFHFLLDKANNLSTQKVNLDLAIRYPNKDKETNKPIGLSVFNITALAENFLDYSDTFVTYPDDIELYKEHDLKIPNIKDWIPIDQIPNFNK